MKDSWWQGQTRFGISPGLSRIQALLDRLGHPETAYPVVHIAGTNGKGSVSAMIEAALRSQGLRVGWYISPDLGRVNERVMIDGAPLDERRWDDWAWAIEEAGRGLVEVPSWFETITALAFLAFRETPVDVAVVEVGLGGRLDATNVVPVPALAVITPVAFDHRRYLGNTIESIAAEKAGIIKAGGEVVLARQPYPKARQVILSAAQAVDATVWEAEPLAWVTPAGSRRTTASGRVVAVPLLGAYQAPNLDTAWAAIERLTTKGLIRDHDRVISALRSVYWPGRFQVVSMAPLVVVDGAHNPHGIAGVLDTLRVPPWNQRRWRVVFGVLADKDAAEMLALLVPHVTHLTLTRVPGERGSDPAALASALPRQASVTIVQDPLAAIRAEQAALAEDEALLVTGSLALMGWLKLHGVIADRPGNVSNPDVEF